MPITKAEERALVLLPLPAVREAMAIRCEEQGHDWTGACDAFLRVYQACKWCGARR